MSSRSIQDHVQLLVERNMVEKRTGGILNSDTESLSVFENIILTFILNPRVSLYFAILARNGLETVVQEEISQIDLVRAAVLDLRNKSYAITDLTPLQQARVSLIQMASAQNIKKDSPALTHFNKSIETFLQKSLAKNVKQKNSAEMIRTSEEAETDLPSLFSDLQELHSDLLDRLYSVIFGVENFLSLPLSTYVGLASITRIRFDIESMISDLETSSSTSAARDLAIRNITNRSTLNTLCVLPTYKDPLVSTTSKLPNQRTITVKSAETPAQIVIDTGPFNFPSNTLSMTVGSSTVSVKFPQQDFDLNSRACVIGEEITGTVTIPPEYNLILTFTEVDLEGNDVNVNHRIPLAAGTWTFAQILTYLQTHTPSGCQIAEFVKSGTSRLIVIANTARKVHIALAHTEDEEREEPDGGGTYTYLKTWWNSAHELLGFKFGDYGLKEEFPVEATRFALQASYGDLIDASITNSGLTIQTLSTDPEISITISGSPSGFLPNGTVLAVSDTFYAIENGEVVNPVGLFGVSDLMETSQGTYSIASVTSEYFQTLEPLNTFEGNLQIDSILLGIYQKLTGNLKSFLDSWLKGPYATDLSKIDAALAGLNKASTVSKIKDAERLLNALQVQLYNLLSTLQDPTVNLPANSALIEMNLAQGMINSLMERKYDRAVEFLRYCKIQEALGLTHDTASYAGNLLKLSSDVAQNDFTYPDRSIDEGTKADHILEPL